ncbi:UNVERIFIED_CONTAM: hypothetical protein PYX00_011923 [Menopon gallinae]|uniref:phenylalanine--tRNA ligase n=1 Tax=Menopon gallinae TaxID=328185 RepID=A0AAW2H909_9NEOP
MHKWVETLHPLEVRVIRAFEGGGELSSLMLMEKLAYSTGQANQALSWLSAKGLLQETRRQSFRCYELTDKGREWLKSDPALALRELAKTGKLNLVQVQETLGIDQASAGKIFGQYSKEGILDLDKDKKIVLRSDKISYWDILHTLLEEADNHPKGLLELDTHDFSERELKVLEGESKKRSSSMALFRLIDKQVPHYSFDLTLLEKAKEYIQVKELTGEEIGPLSSSMLRDGSWKEYLQAVKDELVKRGFEEFDGPIVETEFWNNDALFMPQFHAARDIHDVYYVKEPSMAQQIEEPYLSRVAQAHERDAQALWQALGKKYELKEFSSYLSIAKAELDNFDEKSAKWQEHAQRLVIVKKGLEELRPFLTAFVARGKVIDELLLEELIQSQEKLSWNYGRKRKALSVGMYPCHFTYPLVYEPCDPHTTKFVPLGESQELSFNEILQKTAKGREFAHLLQGFKRHPVLKDSQGKILSYPPILNSQEYGAVKVGDSEIFVELTGNCLESLWLASSVLACDLSDLGFEIEPVRVEYETGQAYTTPYYFQKERTFTLDAVSQTIGETFSQELVEKALTKMGITGLRFEGNIATLLPPVYRNDFLHAVDIIEDVVIGHGLANLNPSSDLDCTLGRLLPVEILSRRMAKLMVGMGFQEMLYNYLGSRADLIEKLQQNEKDFILIANPMSEQYEVLRNSIVPNLLMSESVSAHAVYPHAFFEIGKVVYPSSKDPSGSRTFTNLAWLYAAEDAGFSKLYAQLTAFFYYLSLDWYLGEREDKRFIAGRWPAAHTSAIYCARSGLATLVFEGFMAEGVPAGGQLMLTSEIENFPGFPQGILGSQLMDQMRLQTLKMGATILTQTVEGVDLSQRPFKVFNSTQEVFLAHSLIIATGAQARLMSELKGHSSYWQKGISACAVCDGALPIYRDCELAVVGGGDSACEEALYLTRYASRVHIILRRDRFRASQIMQERVLRNSKISVHYQYKVIEALGDGQLLNAIRLQSTISGEERVLNVKGLFYAIGHVPNSSFLKGQLDLDAHGYVITQRDVKTSIRGVFAAGDLVDPFYRQAVVAAGSGCKAALEAMRYLEEELG